MVIILIRPKVYKHEIQGMVVICSTCRVPAKLHCNFAGHNIERFMAAHKKESPIGLVIYTGNEIAEIRKNIWAVPDWALFSGWTHGMHHPRPNA